MICFCLLFLSNGDKFVTRQGIFVYFVKIKFVLFQVHGDAIMLLCISLYGYVYFYNFISSVRVSVLVSTYPIIRHTRISVKISILPYFIFIVPPLIHPFSFDEAVNSGEFVTLICAIYKGDFPINITWTLNGERISIFDGITATYTNKRSSQLTIESAQAHHSGEYKCLAQNTVGFAQYSSYLNVNGTFVKCIISSQVFSLFTML